MNTNDPNKEFTKENFKIWLHKQPKNRTFLYMSNTGCVIASFLKETLGLASVFFTNHHWGPSVYAYTIETPEWAKKLDLVFSTISISQDLTIDSIRNCNDVHVILNN